MSPEVAKQVEGLRNMTLPELRRRYAEVFGEPTGCRHRRRLQKRIAWQLQANEEGGLSERALRRAEELAEEAYLLWTGPKRSENAIAGRTIVGRFSPSHDRRLPMPGGVLTREYRGKQVSVTVLDDGFEYRGQVYKSLTAVAKAITGTHWNGFGFFGLGGRKERR